MHKISKSALLGVSLVFLSVAAAQAGGNINIAQAFEIVHKSVVNSRPPVLAAGNQGSGATGNGGFGSRPMMPVNPTAYPLYGLDIVPGDGGKGVEAEQTAELSPLGLSCYFQGEFSNGAPEMWLKNMGDKTLPAGTVVIVRFSNGKSGQVVLSSDLKPGHAVGHALGFPVPDGIDLSCSAKVKS